MKKQVVVHKNDNVPYPGWRFAKCGVLAGPYLEDRIANRWSAVTCKSCLRLAPKAVKVRLGIA
jgi:hypothetical protein